MKVSTYGNLLVYLLQKTESMSEYKIKVVLLDEALTFVRSLPMKVQEKIVYNYKKIENGLMSKEFLKSWMIRKYGNFGRSITVIATDCFLFGIQKRRLLLSLLMVS